jgi:hypothetical protein
VTPRKHREDFGGDKQQLVLATFGEEGTADEAANRLKEWERSSEDLKFDAIGVLVKNKRGNVKGRKLGGGLMGVLFPHGRKVTDENLARIGHKFDASQASVGVLTWDFESRVVSNKLRELGGIPQTHEVAKLRA